MKRVAIHVLVALSLILNVVFAVLLMRGQQPDTARSTVTSTTQPVVTATDATTIASYHRALYTKGLSEKERAALMLAYLQERFAQADAQQQADDAQEDEGGGEAPGGFGWPCGLEDTDVFVP